LLEVIAQVGLQGEIPKLLINAVQGEQLKDNTIPALLTVALVDLWVSVITAQRLGTLIPNAMSQEIMT
jgi:hypothetical protein